MNYGDKENQYSTCDFDPSKGVRPMENTMEVSTAKVDKNKPLYDQLFAKMGQRKDHLLGKEEVEKVVAQLEECSVHSKSLLLEIRTSHSSGQREIKKQRIVSRRLNDIVDVFVASKTIAQCFIDIDEPEHYKCLADSHFIMMATSAARTFRNSSTDDHTQLSKTNLDKITTSAERLAMSVAEVIGNFPGEDGMTTLLNMIIQKYDSETIGSVENTIRLAIKDQL